MPLTAAQIAQFHADGYVLQCDVFAPDTLTDLRAEIDARSGWTVNRDPAQAIVWSQPWIRAEEGRGFTPVRDLSDQGLWQTVCHGLLFAHATQLLGESIIFDGATGIVKPAKKGQTFPLHQDGAYYGPADGRYVCANVYLDDVTPDNGSLRVVPGSHTHLREHSEALGKKQLVGADFPALIEPQAKAGDVLWFHLWTVHGSGPNLSTSIRRAVRAGWGVP